jgi:hypothetical protein
MPSCRGFCWFLLHWGYSILTGDCRLAISALLIVGIVVLQLAFIKNLPRLLAAFESVSEVGLPLALLLLFVTIPLVIFSCRGALLTVSRVRRSERRRALALAGSESESESEGVRLLANKPQKPKAGKTGKKGRRKF